MEDARREPLEVIRARRIEIVDDRDTTRVAIGRASNESTGVVVFDRAGHQRASLLAHDAGALLSFTYGGNPTMEIGVYDEHSTTVIPGCYIVMCDHQGTPIVRWTIAPDGTIVETPPTASD